MRTAIILSILAIAIVASDCHAAKASFDRSKPHLNIGTIGHVDHGKTTLTAAITTVLRTAGMPVDHPFGQIAHTPPHAPPIHSGLYTSEYETATRIYVHVDCPGHADYVRFMVSSPQMGGAILVVSAVQGMLPQTREHILLARQVGVPRLVVFLDDADQADPAAVDRLEHEIRQALAVAGFPDPGLIPRGDLELAATGDARAAGPVWELVDGLERELVNPVPAVDQDFLMEVERVRSVNGRGTVVTGRIETGFINAGDEVELVGLLPSSGTVIPGVEMFRGGVVGGEAGESLQVVLPGIAADSVAPGQVLALPGSITANTHFHARIYVLKREEGGRHTPFHNKYRPRISIRNTDLTGTITLPQGVDSVFPGESLTVDVDLDAPVAMDEQLRFAIREGGRTIGAGVIVSTR